MKGSMELLVEPCALPIKKGGVLSCIRRTKEVISLPLSTCHQLILLLSLFWVNMNKFRVTNTDFRVVRFSFPMVCRCLLQSNLCLFIKTITLIFNHVHSLRSTNISNSVCVCVLKKEEKKITILFSMWKLSVLGREIKLSEQIWPRRAVLNRKIYYCIAIYWNFQKVVLIVRALHNTC
jgi:hypothetical protein